MDEQSPLKRTLWLLLRISRVFGVAPVRFEGNGMCVSTPLALYGIILFGVMCTEYIYQFSYLLSTNNSSDLIKHHVAIRMMYLSLDLIVMAVGTLLGPQRMKVMIEVLAEIDKTKKMESAFLNGIIRVLVYSIVPIVWLLGVCHNYRIGMLWTPPMYLMTCFLHTVAFLMMLYFVILASMINGIILHINDTLEEVVDALSDKASTSVATVLNRRIETQTLIVPIKYINVAVGTGGQVTKSSEDDSRDKLKTEAEKMRGLARTYVMFWSCTRQLNVSEHFALVVYLTVFVVYFSVALLNFFEWLHEGDNMLVWALWMVENLTTCIISAIMLLLLVEPSHIITTQQRQTRLLVNKLLNTTPTDQRLVDGAERLEAQLQLGNPHYSAFAVFELGRPIITAVAGVIITYLLVIVQ